MFAYCENNPVGRVDSHGFFWETIPDIIFFGVGVKEAVENPDDPAAWIGLAVDAASLFVPFLPSGGSLVRTLSKADDFTDATKLLHVTNNSVDSIKYGWQLGDNIDALTRAGKVPSWTTVRQRYWKNEALFNATQYSAENLKLMKVGRAPLVELNGKLYPMELHHIKARRYGGLDSLANLLPVTPWEHSIIDKHRHFVP